MSSNSTAWRHNGSMTDSPVQNPSPPASPSRLAALVWTTLYLGLFGVLAFGMVSGLRMRCEGFGCRGVGVFWVAWSGVYGVTGLIGLWTRSCTRRASFAVGLVRATLWVQLLMGLVLLALWTLN